MLLAKFAELVSYTRMVHRYGSDDIYTFAGPVLIALNPCKTLPLYTAEMATTYRGTQASKSVCRGKDRYTCAVCAKSS